MGHSSLASFQALEVLRGVRELRKPSRHGVLGRRHPRAVLCVEPASDQIATSPEAGDNLDLLQGQSSLGRTRELNQRHRRVSTGARSEVALLPHADEGENHLLPIVQTRDHVGSGLHDDRRQLVPRDRQDVPALRVDRDDVLLRRLPRRKLAAGEELVAGRHETERRRSDLARGSRMTRHVPCGGVHDATGEGEHGDAQRQEKGDSLLHCQSSLVFCFGHEGRRELPLPPDLLATLADLVTTTIPLSASGRTLLLALELTLDPALRRRRRIVRAILPDLSRLVTVGRGRVPTVPFGPTLLDAGLCTDGRAILLLLLQELNLLGLQLLVVGELVPDAQHQENDEERQEQPLAQPHRHLLHATRRARRLRLLGHHLTPFVPRRAMNCCSRRERRRSISVASDDATPSTSSMRS